MKKIDQILRDYSGRLSLDSLKYVCGRLDQRLGSDLAEAIDVISANNDLDRWLASARTCDEFYDMIDKAQEYLERELNRRVPELVEN